MSSKWRGKSLPNSYTLHLSKAYGKTVWLVYENVS